MSVLFGPVPSRRLGRSLGIDVIPPKTCTYDCVYCESGRTTHLSVDRDDFFSPETVLYELDRYFQRYPAGADVLTFSSAGEPTLYKPLKELVRGIKTRFQSLPLIVLTNGSLLSSPEIREALQYADRVAPTLSTVNERTFQLLHRPHPDIELSDVFEGLKAFRKGYRGQLHVEVMLVAGVNDNPEEWKGLRHFLESLEPDRIELNTVVRPPADPDIRAVDLGTMQAALSCFPMGKSQIIGSFEAYAPPASEKCLTSRVLELVGRRPCTFLEMTRSLAVSSESLREVTQHLEEHGKLRRCFFGDREYFRLPS